MAKKVEDKGPMKVKHGNVHITIHVGGEEDHKDEPAKKSRSKEPMAIKEPLAHVEHSPKTKVHNNTTSFIGPEHPERPREKALKAESFHNMRKKKPMESSYQEDYE